MAPLLVTMSKRGAPAPQCEPMGLAGAPPLRMSYPSSVTVEGTSRSRAVPAALLFVGPVLASRRPSFVLSLESPVGQPASAYVTVPVVSKLGGRKAWMSCDVGHPSPDSQPDCTRFEFAGSNTAGLTWRKAFAAIAAATKIRNAISTPPINRRLVIDASPLLQWNIRRGECPAYPPLAASPAAGRSLRQSYGIPRLCDFQSLRPSGRGHGDPSAALTSHRLRARSGARARQL